MKDKEFGPHSGISKMGTGPGVRTQQLYWMEELEKCKASPYYFATKYMTLNGNTFTTHLTEEQFNTLFNSFLKTNTNGEE